MRYKNRYSFVSFVLVLILVSLACGTAQPTPTQEPTATVTVAPSETPTPSPTPTPTKTPNLAATQRVDDLNAEMQTYFEKAYLTTTDGKFIEYDDFAEDTAQLTSYSWWILDEKASDFYMSAHFEWSSAYKNADVSGCGFVFAVQDNNEHYAVFLDRAKVFFLDTTQSYGGARPIGTTRGTGHVNIEAPTGADFTLIVRGAYAYVLVNNELVGEYTLTQSRPLYGNIGLTVLSGTNKDYGTRCKMTNLHLWVPNED